MIGVTEGQWREKKRRRVADTSTVDGSDEVHSHSRLGSFSYFLNVTILEYLLLFYCQGAHVLAWCEANEGRVRNTRFDLLEI